MFILYLYLSDYNHALSVLSFNFYYVLYFNHAIENVDAKIQTKKETRL